MNLIGWECIGIVLLTSEVSQLVQKYNFMAKFSWFVGCKIISFYILFTEENSLWMQARQQQYSIKTARCTSYLYPVLHTLQGTLIRTWKEKSSDCQTKSMNIFGGILTKPDDDKICGCSLSLQLLQSTVKILKIWASKKFAVIIP